MRIESAIYQMQDNDPMLFERWLQSEPHESYYRSHPVYAYTSLVYGWNHCRDENIPRDNIRDIAMQSEVIARVRVDRMFNWIDSSGQHPREFVSVQATIVDPIKGKRVPACAPQSTMVHLAQARLVTVSSAPGACLNFEYRRDRGGQSSCDMNMKGDVTWIREGGEFFVFLSVQRVGHGNHGPIYALWPLRGTSSSAGMYPIVAGNVIDRFDDFGLGQFVSAEQFISKLRGEITAIKSRWTVAGSDCALPAAIRFR
ncbi:MAG: hypothetical protein H7X80_10170 [bacterium]|nr:hypothetical protein [Candidatus Kapabacteria bacterium]